MNLSIIRKELPQNYQIQWKEENEKHPIVIRFNGGNKEEVSMRWKCVMEKLANNKSEQNGKQENEHRIKINGEGHSIHATIYLNSTVMLQGKGNGKWLADNIIEIAKEISKETPEKTHKRETTNQDFLKLSQRKREDCDSYLNQKRSQKGLSVIIQMRKRLE